MLTRRRRCETTLPKVRRHVAYAIPLIARREPRSTLQIKDTLPLLDALVAVFTASTHGLRDVRSHHNERRQAKAKPRRESQPPWWGSFLPSRKQSDARHWLGLLHQEVLAL
jgi:hypothetical protein